MFYDKFDIISAHYAFAVDFHGGQWTDLYAKLCSIQKYFNPGPLWKGYDSLTENGQAIYDALVQKQDLCCSDCGDCV